MPEDYSTALSLISQSLGRIETQLSLKADKADIARIDSRVEKVESKVDAIEVDVATKATKHDTELATAKDEVSKRASRLTLIVSALSGLAVLITVPYYLSQIFG